MAPSPSHSFKILLGLHLARSAAFDTVDHTILIDRLKPSVGVCVSVFPQSRSGQETPPRFLRAHFEAPSWSHPRRAFYYVVSCWSIVRTVFHYYISDKLCKFKMHEAKTPQRNPSGISANTSYRPHSEPEPIPAETVNPCFWVNIHQSHVSVAFQCPHTVAGFHDFNVSGPFHI